MTMAMANTHPKRRDGGLDYVSLGILFLCVVAIILVLVGVATIGTNPLAIILPALVGFWAITTLKR
jgi:hypothetical protein